MRVGHDGSPFSASTMTPRRKPQWVKIETLEPGQRCRIQIRDFPEVPDMLFWLVEVQGTYAIVNRERPSRAAGAPEGTMVRTREYIAATTLVEVY
jgi:hypothetical protein